MHCCGSKFQRLGLITVKKNGDQLESLVHMKSHWSKNICSFKCKFGPISLKVLFCSFVGPNSKAGYRIVEKFNLGIWEVLLI